LNVAFTVECLLCYSSYTCAGGNGKLHTLHSNLRLHTALGKMALFYMVSSDWATLTTVALTLLLVSFST